MKTFAPGSVSLQQTLDAIAHMKSIERGENMVEHANYLRLRYPQSGELVWPDTKEAHDTDGLFYESMTRKTFEIITACFGEKWYAVEPPFLVVTHRRSYKTLLTTPSGSLYSKEIQLEAGRIMLKFAAVSAQHPEAQIECGWV